MINFLLPVLLKSIVFNKSVTIMEPISSSFFDKKINTDYPIVSQYDFALNLQNQISQPGQNVIFSPYSILIAMSMCYLGAANRTKAQMKKVLYAENLSDQIIDNYLINLANVTALESVQSSDQDLALRSANRFYLQRKFNIKNEYVVKLIKIFKTQVQKVDFGQNPEKIRQDINKWVAKETNNRIKDLIPEKGVNQEAVSVLVNALYMLAKWENPFLPENTLKDTFYATPSNMLKIDMMRQTKKFSYAETKNFQMLEMPYSSRSTKMVVILPKENFGLENVMKSLNGLKLKKTLTELKRRQVEVRFPKFKVEQNFNLNEALMKLGIQDAFNGKANFSKMTEEPVFISNVFHKAFVEINEKGTEAAAATAVVISRTSLEIPDDLQPIKFNANHPFLMLILAGQEKNVLFMGKFYGPK